MSKKLDKENIVHYDIIPNMFFDANAYRTHYIRALQNFLKSDSAGCTDEISFIMTCYFLSVEQFLKLVYVISCFEEDGKDRNKEFDLSKIKQHNLDDLLDLIPEKIVNELQKSISKVDDVNIRTVLLKYKGGFIDWRYSYEKTELNADIIPLIELCQVLYKYCDFYINNYYISSDSKSADRNIGINIGRDFDKFIEFVKNLEI